LKHGQKHTGTHQNTYYKQSSVPILQGPKTGHVTSDIEKANILNTVFTSNFDHIDTEHPKYNQADYTLPPSTEFPEELKEQVFTLISSLSVSKSTGTDNIKC